MREQVAFTNRISLWLKAAGVEEPDVRATLAVGLADLTHAADVVAHHLQGMLNERLVDAQSADALWSMRPAFLPGYLLS